ncbi:MAG: PAS domain S-box protein [Acidobacteria bacterium]|nr:PAS domain S-box protein [Acidobacteriota bacterium]
MSALHVESGERHYDQGCAPYLECRMSLSQISALLVEDNPGDARLIREAVREAEGTLIRLSHADTLEQALQRVRGEHFDVVMLDLSLPDAEGLDTVVRMHAEVPAIPIVVLTGLDDEALAVRAVREGAQDYLVKGQVTSQLLVRAMRYATERKRAVEALQRSEEYFRSLIENALDIIMVVDEDGTIRFGSPSVTRVLGYEPGEFHNQNLLSLIVPEDEERVRTVLGADSDPGGAQPFECRIRRRDGAWRVLEVIGRRFTSGAASVLNARDVTERRHAEEQVRQANETLRAVIETSPLAIYTLDLQGNVKSWNAAAEHIFGYTAGEVIDQPLPTVFPEDQRAFRTKLEEAVAGQPLVGMEATRRRKDGSVVEVSVWSAQLRDGAGMVTGVVVVVADNTERKRLEEQFRQVQKMEAVGRLAGGVAHDFNNLLTVIAGYCQMLLDRLDPSDPLHEDMEQVLKAADRATALTKQLLAFSRKQVVQPKVVDLGALVHDMNHMLKRLVGEDIDLQVLVHEPVGKVKVDPGQIEQVIVNLVVNARDAMALGGRVTIELENAEIDREFLSRHLGLESGPYLMLAVSDTGIGIPPEIRAHLFEPFFTTKEKGRGTGLGLSTSYGVVKQSKGEIVVYSEVGRGTTFKVFLPRVEEPLDAEVIGAPERDRWRGSETVLVVEDEDGVRKVMQEMLNQQGYTVLAAAGGPEALEMVEGYVGPLDLLITDVIMPRMSGRELADRVRGLRSNVKVLFVSGYTDTVISQHGILDPGVAFLQKPFTPEQLSGKVRELLESRTGTPQASRSD